MQIVLGEIHMSKVSIFLATSASISGPARPLLPALVLMLFAGCATATPVLVQSPSYTRQSAVSFDGQKIFILSPKIVYRDASSDRELPSAGSRARGPDSELLSYAQESIPQRDFSVMSFNDLTSEEQLQLDGILSTLKESSNELFKTWKKREDLQQSLEILKESVHADAVLAQILEVRLGTSGTWDPVVSGAVTAGTNSSEVKMGLFETSTGNLVWKRSAYFRQIPERGLLYKSLQMLYADFPHSSTERNGEKPT